MAHPVTWSKSAMFFPIRDTLPICLTQTLSPEKNANILLLDCGDARSILFTVYADLCDGNRPLDFTCCDREPAVLARNIILLTMIVDGVPEDVAWSTYFHFFLDKTSHDILVTQCQALLQSSVDMMSWKASKYGHFLRFCTEHSFVEIRRHWSLYSKSGDLSEAEHAARKLTFQYAMNAVNKSIPEAMLCTLRSAGPLFYSFAMAAVNTYPSFWTSGVADPAPSETTSRPYANPTFAYSLNGGIFHVGVDLNPIGSFFLASAVALEENGDLPTSATPESLFNCAKSQFSSWYFAFKTRLSLQSTSNLVIRFFVGESFAFCQALHICKERKTIETGIYAHAWGAPPIVLDADDYSSSSTGSSPLLFNVIETSHLVDLTGTLNVLLVTVPLLEKTPWSILYTTTAIGLDHDGPKTSRFARTACADIPTLSMLLGIAPSPSVWHFTTYSNTHEVATAKPSPPGRIHERIPWRFVSSFVPNTGPTSQEKESADFALLFDTEKLADLFFAVYLQMFDDEDVRRHATVIATRTPPTDQLLEEPTRFTRATFAAFLALVKGSVKVDWAETMEILVDFVCNDEILMTGINNFEDLMCQMYMRNLFTAETFTSEYLESVRTPRDRFGQWKDVPLIVCVMLRIPRHRMRRIEHMNPSEISAPRLQCNIIDGSKFCNCFWSVYFNFGKIYVSDTDGEPCVSIEEDPSGWTGDSDLIASFYVPTYLLLIQPTSTRVTLTYHLIGSTRVALSFTIFSTFLTDTALVHITHHRPSNVLEVGRLRDTPAYNTLPASQNITDIMPKLDSSNGRVTQLIVRKNIADPIAAQALAQGSRVSVTPLTDSSALATFEGYSYRFDYPFPIRVKYLRTRTDRKASQITIEAPIRSNASDLRQLSLNPFPVANDGEQINILNIHYIKLDILPSLSLPREEEKIDWILIHIGAAFSYAEKCNQIIHDEDVCRTLYNVKQNIRTMIISHAGLEPNKAWSNVSALTGPHDKYEIHTLFYVNSMKLDLASHTVVIDACVVPLLALDKRKRDLAKQVAAKHCVGLSFTGEDEKRTWNHLLPVLAERCRTWKHTDTCEYRTKGIPASIEGSDQSPLCICGRGKDLGEFGTRLEWSAFHGEATRVAISPLVVSLYLEDVRQFMSRGDEGTSKRVSRLHCFQCGGPGKPKLLVCSSCMKARYCSRECQKSHWKHHKKECADSQ
ncbi:hypothetical protein BDN70DRAFT_857261 [Pholiota conissans]|uniref:MYND-type domain-containing protein n=1 Tax=Pholiota conissans TaxID=109636 RepID=A0A9P5Z6A2_9AGAR|nr:hypothetical protein BDN70DRAFT_857261 [Pholiota conissans]